MISRSIASAAGGRGTPSRFISAASIRQWLSAAAHGPPGRCEPRPTCVFDDRLGIGRRYDRQRWPAAGSSAIGSTARKSAHATSSFRETSASRCTGARGFLGPTMDTSKVWQDNLNLGPGETLQPVVSTGGMTLGLQAVGGPKEMAQLMHKYFQTLGLQTSPERSRTRGGPARVPRAAGRPCVRETILYWLLKPIARRAARRYFRSNSASDSPTPSPRRRIPTRPRHDLQSTPA